MDVATWLASLGLGEHARAFAENQIGSEDLPTLTDEDLRTLGVTALGHRKRILAAVAALATTPLDGLVQQWPSVLAIPLRQYMEETHPVVKLWHACDVVELTLRFMVMVGVAEAAEGGELPEDVARELWDRIEQPTLGRWRGMAEALAPGRTNAPSLVPELRSHLSDVLVPLLDGPTRPRTAQTSFSQLRNHLAHGAGVTQAAAARLLAQWQPRFEDSLAKAAWLGELSLIVRDAAGRFGELRGPTTKPATPRQPITEGVTGAATRPDSVLLARGERVLTLWPLALYGEPRAAGREPMGIGESPQVYTRRGEVQLEYTPLGSDGACQAVGEETALGAFKKVFRLEKKRAEAAAAGFTVRGFEREVRRDSERLVGRHSEIEALGKLARETDGGFIWVSGRPGIGKSYVVSRVASDLLDEAGEGRLVLPYRFKVGDDRCGRESFLRLATERLGAWAAGGVERWEEDERQREEGRPLDRLKKLLAALPKGRRVIFVLDGLDEIAERDRDFATEVPLGLRGRGVLWLCAGRPERGLPEVFRKAGAIEPFPEGLPRMSEGDTRTMLLEKIGPLRKKLLRGDRDEGDRVVNPFVERVAKNAEGLPIYVTYVIGDVLEGKVSPDPGAPLPPSLVKYHEELLQRCSVGDLHQVMTPLAATLAIGKEPLTAEELTALLARRGILTGADGSLDRVHQALSAIASMVTLAPDPDGGEGYTLWHHSLRQHMLTSPQMKESIATARKAMADAGLHPAGDGAERYLYRHGIAHLLGQERRKEALALLTDFPYLMERLKELSHPGGVDGITLDWVAALTAGSLSDQEQAWQVFWREREHILRRGDERWPANRILLQLAVEHADDSPVTKQAEEWLAAGNGNWFWLRASKRPPRLMPNPCLRVLEVPHGRPNAIKGALSLPHGRVLFWSFDGTLHVWDADTGRVLRTRREHGGCVMGVALLPDGRVLSWSEDRTLRTWSGELEAELAVLRGHPGIVRGAVVVSDHRIVSWSDDDNSAYLWDGSGGTPLAILRGHRSWLMGARALSDGRIVSWSQDSSVRVWADDGSPLSALLGHTGLVAGADTLPDGRLLSWSWDRTLRIWDPDSGWESVLLKGHTEEVLGATALSEGCILSWSRDRTLRLWDSSSGAEIAVLEGHRNEVHGVAVLPDARILSWCGYLGASVGPLETTLYVWDQHTGEKLGELVGHSGIVLGALVLPGDGILSWSLDGTLRVWDARSFSPVAVLEGHAGAVDGATALPDGRIVSWSPGSLRLWSGDFVRTRKAGHVGLVWGAAELPDGRLLSWGDDGTLRTWDPTTGAEVSTLRGHTAPVPGAAVLPDGDILSWSHDGSLRIWDGKTGATKIVLEGHGAQVRGARRLPDGRILSWAQDGTARVWDGASRAQLLVLEHSPRRSGPALIWTATLPPKVWGARFFEDGRIFSWSETTAHLWNGRTGERLASPKGHVNWITGVIALADDRILSWSSSERPLLIWDSTTGATILPLAGHTNGVNGAMALTDGRLLSWSQDSTLRLWDPKTGDAVGVLRGHTSEVRGARQLDDGRVVSWARDGEHCVWDVLRATLLFSLRWEVMPWRAPDVLARLTTQALRQSCVGWRSRSRFAMLPVTGSRSAVACWEGGSTGDVRLLTDDGTLAITTRDAGVAFLKLYRGADRATLGELVAHAQEDFSPADPLKSPLDEEGKESQQRVPLSEPDETRYLRDLATAHEKQAELHEKADPSAARRLLLGALRPRERLAEIDGSVPNLRDLSIVYLNIGCYDSRLDRPDAPGWFDKALGIRRHLVQEAPAEADLWERLARACHERGAWEQRHGRPAEARPYFDECFAALDRALELAPGASSAHYLRACITAVLGRSEESLAALDRAVHLGYVDADEAFTERDLETLRGLPRFQELIAEMRVRYGPRG